MKRIALFIARKEMLYLLGGVFALFVALTIFALQIMDNDIARFLYIQGHYYSPNGVAYWIINYPESVGKGGIFLYNFKVFVLSSGFRHFTQPFTVALMISLLAREFISFIPERKDDEGGSNRTERESPGCELPEQM